MQTMSATRALIIFALVLSGMTVCHAKEARIVKVEAVEYQEKIIYHSPDTPGFSAWVGLWRVNDKKVYCDFRQVTGPKDNPKTEYPLLESNDEGRTWKVVPLQAAGNGMYQTGRESCRGMEVLDGGKTLVRPVWPASVNVAGYIVRSTDGGKTWSKRIDLLPEDKWGVWPTLVRKLRDGRLVLLAGCWRRGEKIASGDGPMRKMMFISKDKGETWGEPIPLLTPGQGICEESDFRELPNGDLFWIHRSEFYPDHATDVPAGACRMGASPPQSNWYSIRNQSIARKKGDTFV
ncbi:MAG: sialidase family protein, partial [Armatimonadota bacterium]|nr:sialidase family protein [Armatimonadota bacterium]